MTDSSEIHAQSVASTVLSTRIIAWSEGTRQAESDVLAVERPLEIHIAGASPLITMRTPGHDRELAVGLLFGEGVIHRGDDVVYIKPSPGEADVLRVMLRPEARDRLSRIERSTLINSACGVCGKSSFRPPRSRGHTGSRAETPRIQTDWLLTLPEQLRAHQALFKSTGGLHAAALFAANGELIALREDVGRHNAVDKLIGHALLNDRLPLHDMVLVLSGRASYELVQKATRAELPIVCAISAPSSYAVELAAEFSMTLVGFIRDRRFNVYSGATRIDWEGVAASCPEPF